MKDFLLLLCPPHPLSTPPLSIAYLKSFLKHKKISFDVQDINCVIVKHMPHLKFHWNTLNSAFENNVFTETKNKLPYYIHELSRKARKYRFVGFSLSRRNLSFSLALAEKIAHCGSPRIIFGGPEILWQYHQNNRALFERGIQVIGEGEKPLLDILEKPRPQTMYLHQEIENLDTLPFLNLSSIEPERYNRTIALLASRGCIGKCTFCAEKNLTAAFRFHSPHYVVDHLEYLSKKYNVSNFTFHDSLLNFNISWLEKFCQLLNRRKLDLKWQAQMIIRPDMDRNILKLIKKSGCINIFLGLESGSNYILNKMGKYFQKEDAKCMFQNLIAEKIFFEISLMVGYPGEDDFHFQETLAFLKENKKIIPKIAQLNCFVPYPASDIMKTPVPWHPQKHLRKRLRKAVDFILKEKIRHKKSFIDNLYDHSQNQVAKNSFSHTN